MDDLTVLDGVCDEIIKQGKFSKCKPQINNSFITILAYCFRFKSDRLFSTAICIPLYSKNTKCPAYWNRRNSDITKVFVSPTAVTTFVLPSSKP